MAAGTTLPPSPWLQIAVWQKDLRVGSLSYDTVCCCKLQAGHTACRAALTTVPQATCIPPALMIASLRAHSLYAARSWPVLVSARCLLVVWDAGVRLFFSTVGTCAFEALASAIEYGFRVPVINKKGFIEIRIHVYRTQESGLHVSAVTVSELSGRVPAHTRAETRRIDYIPPSMCVHVAPTGHAAAGRHADTTCDNQAAHAAIRSSE